jgi:cobalt-zinc-cadmium efflux system outer membrane protein
MRKNGCKLSPGACRMAVIACGFVLLSGCSSGRERQAFRHYREVEHIAYGESETPSRPEQKLPLLTTASTIQDYLRYAALHNPGLEAAFNRWKAALEKIPQARALPDPRFTYAWFIQNVETRVGPQENKLGGSQTLPWLDKLRLRGGIAMEGADAAKEQYEAVKLQLFYTVKDAYYEYYYLARAIDITRENRELLTYFEKIARTKYKVGTAQHPDVIKAQVELGKIDDQLRTLEDLREPVVAKLNAALGRPVQEPLPEPGSIPEERIEATDDELIAWMREANPELKALGFDIEREKKGVTLAREDFIPDATFGFDWIDTGKGPSGVSDSGKDPYIAGVSVNLPIWYGKYKAAEREARARFIAAQNSRRDRENNLAYELQLALYNYRDAERKINLYRDTLIPKGKESLKATEAAYRAARLDFLNLIDAQQILLEFQLSYERALANCAQRRAELEMLVGREIPRSGSILEESKVTWERVY